MARREAVRREPARLQAEGVISLGRDHRWRVSRRSPAPGPSVRVRPGDIPGAEPSDQLIAARATITTRLATAEEDVADAIGRMVESCCEQGASTACAAAFGTVETGQGWRGGPWRLGEPSPGIEMMGLAGSTRGTRGHRRAVGTAAASSSVVDAAHPAVAAVGLRTNRRSGMQTKAVAAKK